ncbi:MAG: hypothetical protein QMD14_00825 [Candidatus Aenigmarchaeota archaeon]|nr:hypothetical protein [Candidatus Aenigmarchaeota archaeon]
MAKRLSRLFNRPVKRSEFEIVVGGTFTLSSLEFYYVNSKLLEIERILIERGLSTPNSVTEFYSSYFPHALLLGAVAGSLAVADGAVRMYGEITNKEPYKNGFIEPLFSKISRLSTKISELGKTKLYRTKEAIST